MGLLNIDRLVAEPLKHQPFEYVIVPGFLDSHDLDAVVDNYPALKGGSYPLESVDLTPTLQRLIDEMDGPAFEQAIAEKFAVALEGRAKMYSLRGHCRETDGKIHTDSKDKIITVLLYLNRDWPHEHGKLRLLRSGDNLADFADEVAPDNGTLLVFRRSDRSWHGHGPFEGQRRSIQMNWMVSDSARTFHKLRHSLSAGLKKLMPAH